MVIREKQYFYYQIIRACLVENKHIFSYVFGFIRIYTFIKLAKFKEGYILFSLTSENALNLSFVRLFELFFLSIVVFDHGLVDV